MRREDRAALEKIIRYCSDIEILMERYDKSFEKYKNDIAFQYACSMCLIQIGEAAGRLSAEIQQTNSDIPWRAIKAMRNLHAHDYDNVDLSIVWYTLENDINDLKAKITAILNSFGR